MFGFEGAVVEHPPEQPATQMSFWSRQAAPIKKPLTVAAGPAEEQPQPLSWPERQLRAPLSDAVRSRLREEYFAALASNIVSLPAGEAGQFLLCQPAAKTEYAQETRLGEGSYSTPVALYDGTDAFTQAVREPRGFASFALDGPRAAEAAETHMVVYAKERVSMWNPQTWDDEPEPVLAPVGEMQLPTAPWPLGSAVRCGEPRCDVWSANLEIAGLKELLDSHGQATQDRPIPRYQMLIDPNQFVRGSCWVPCEFHVSSDGTPTLLGGERAHAYPELVRAVATPVLQAGLPLLAQLRRPALMLQDRTLQVAPLSA